MDKLKKEKQEHPKFEIGGYLLFAIGSFLFFLGICPIFGFSIPSINLKGMLRSSLDGWLIYGIMNFLDLLGDLISFFRWHNLLDIINISLLFTVNILLFFGGVISFQRKNKIGLIGTILFIVVLLLVIVDLFAENLIFQLPFPSEPNIILHIIDTNIIIIIALGFLGGYFSYFKK
ncbi:MAG: hypothetical protein HWN67_12370 [Candidatus Helarchaeota archaeon]|nr:hypothetical protein [Candidatus Helarchaeota archaeon]